MESYCRTKIISDAPAPVDAFGSHERIATTLAELIKTERGGKTIAIEGGWGSGKSTVINLLRKKTTLDPKLVLLVFDAWTHEGDPLRRTFLEKLYRALVDAGWIYEKQWKDTMDYLSKRKKDSKTTTRPRLTLFAKCLLASTFVVPIGFALLTSALRNPIYFLPGPGRILSWQFMIGIILNLAPLFVLVCAWFRRASSDTWAVLVKGTTTTTCTEAIETPEPTSVEFHSIFLDLMNAALELNMDRRIILVIDNLDRVVPGDALSIWSSLCTFCQLSEHRTPSWFEQFWIVVPYDPQGIRRLWEGTGNGKEVAKSFLSKTFQLRLSVPPLLVSNWRQYLNGLLKEAFPDHNQDDFHVIYRLYAALLEPSKSPTPRSLKLYVNDIGFLHRQWQDTMPLSDLAYFILLKHRDVDVEEELRKTMVPTREVQDLVSPEILDNLAALAFNTSVSEARQILLRDKLTQTLEQADTETLKSLNLSPGFWEILESIDFSQWSEHEPSKLTNAARCIVESGITAKRDSIMKESTLSHIQSATFSVSRWRPLGTDIGHGLSALCQLCGDETLVQHLFYTLSLSDEKSDDKIKPADWVLTVVPLLETVNKYNLYPMTSGQIAIPGPAQITLEVCHNVAEQDPDARFWNVFQVNVAADTLDAAINASLINDSLLPMLVDALKVLRVMDVKINTNTLVEIVRGRLRSVDSLVATSVEALLDILVDLRSSMPAAENSLTELASSGYLLHHLYIMYQNATTPAVARCLLLYLEQQSSLVAPSRIGKAVAGHQIATKLINAPPPELVSAVIEYLSVTNQTKLLFKISKENNAINPFVAECLRHATNPNTIAEFFPPETVYDNWPLLSEIHADEKLRIFVALLIEKTGLVQYLSEREFDSTRGSLYAFMVGSGAADKLQQVCIDGLKKIDADTWLAELLEETNLANLIVDLVESEINFELGHPFHDSLLEHARKMALGEVKPTYLSAEHWQELLSPLHPDSRKVFRSGLFEVALSAQGNISSTFFEYYGQELARVEVLDDSRAISGLFTSLLKAGNNDGLRWMTDFLKAEPEFIKHHQNKSAVKDFLRRFEGMLSSTLEEDTKEVQKLRFELADAIGIVYPKDMPTKEGS